MSSRTERPASTEVVEPAGVRFDPYLSYQTGPFRDSPPIPNHWDNLPNLVLFDERNERGYEELPVFSVTQDRGVVRQDSLEYSVAEAAKDRSSYKRVRNGDLVYNKMRMWQGAVGRATADGIVSPAYVVLKPKETVDSRFFAYFYRSSVGLVQSNRLSYGIVDDQNSLRCSDFLSGRSPVPPKQEQVLIADFLDRQTSRINDLIAKKERLIELLDEKRTALITQAVTKGLDPDVPMKDSGVEWLGEIPEHWDVPLLDKLIDPSRPITYGIVQPGDKDPDGILMVRGQNYSNGWDSTDKIFRVAPEVEAPYRRARLSEGDVVMTIVGAGTGNVAVVPRWLEGANITQTTARLAFNPKACSNRFFFFLLQSSIGHANVDLAVKGAAQPGLNLNHIAKFRVVCPPREEQRRIADFLDGQTTTIDSLIKRVRSAQQLLAEYRSALITAAVTGKIDVRDQAA